MSAATYLELKAVNKRLKRMEKMLMRLVDQDDDRRQAKKLAADVKKTTAALGAAITPDAP